MANRKHGRRTRSLEQRRKQALQAGAEQLSKGKLHRLAGPPIPKTPG